MKVYNTALEAKIAGRNKVNQKANELAQIYLEAIKPFVGQKIERVAGGFLDKFNKAMPVVATFETDPEFHGCFLSATNYALILRLKVCMTYQNSRNNQFAMYAEETVYLAQMASGVMGELYEFEPRKTDYTAEEVLQARKEHDAARQALTNAQGKLSLWGEHDN